MRKRPNILFCIADDASHFGYNGHGAIRTPHIDRLAEHGAILANAFTTNPKCAPSRACILTGMFPWQLREGCNHVSFFPDNFSVYPDILEAAGYAVGYTGKGWAPGDYIRSGRTRNPAGPEFNKQVLMPPQDSRISDCDYAANFAQFLTAKQDQTPFCFWYGCREPHRPYNLGESCDESVGVDDVQYVPSYWPDEPLIRRDILDYAFEINWFDRHIGKMVAMLEASGQLDDTLILVTSDNGMPFPRVKGQMYEQDFHLPMVAFWKNKIAPGTCLQDLISFVDLAPTFLEAAGIASGDMTGQSFLPLLTGGRETADRQYVYFGREKHDVGRENDLGYPVRCIRSQNWLYIRNAWPDRWPSGNPETQYTNCDFSPTKERIMQLAAEGQPDYLEACFGKRPAEELYAVQSDEECRNNLADDPKYLSVKDQLSQDLDRKLAQTEDPRYLGKGDVFDQYPLYRNHIAPHAWASYLQGTFRPIGPPYDRVKCMAEKNADSRKD